MPTHVVLNSTSRLDEIAASLVLHGRRRVPVPESTGSHPRHTGARSVGESVGGAAGQGGLRRCVSGKAVYDAEPPGIRRQPGRLMPGGLPHVRPPGARTSGIIGPAVAAFDRVFGGRSVLTVM